jgi:hypothetical protein
MKLRLLAIITLAIGARAAAQAVPNGGMEIWEPQLMGMYEDPQSWGTLNIAAALGGSANVTKSPDSHSGQYAARLETIVVDGGGGMLDTAAGFMMLGEIDFMNSTYVQGAPFTARPDSLIFWYKYSPAGADNMGVAAELTYWDGSSNQLVASAEWLSATTVGDYVRMSIPFEYESTETPDSLTVIFSSSASEDDASVGYPGSVLYVDDISTYTNAMASVISLKANEAIRVYPNPAKDVLNVTLAKDAVIEIYNVLGAHVETVRSHSSGTTEIPTSRYNNGVYLLKTSTGLTQRFVVKH